MTLLSVDLGVTTGLAVLSLDGEVLSHEAINVRQLQSRLLFLSETFVISHVVCERPIIMRGPLGEELAYGLSELEIVFEDPKPYYVEAHWWKSHPLAKQAEPKVGTAHERDAIRLGWVYLRRVVAGKKVLPYHGTDA